MRNYEKFEKFVISQKAILIRDDKALILEFANRENVWDLPGGRLDVGETISGSFEREIKEELGFQEFENLGVADYDIWIATKKKVPVCGIVNLIKDDGSDIKISSEHASKKWIVKNEINNYKYLWPNMGRMIEQGFEKYNSIYGKKE